MLFFGDAVSLVGRKYSNLQAQAQLDIYGVEVLHGSLNWSERLLTQKTLPVALMSCLLRLLGTKLQLLIKLMKHKHSCVCPVVVNYVLKFNLWYP